MDQVSSLYLKNNEADWSKVSASLDAASKIYGYRVDSVYTDMMKFQAGLIRTGGDPENGDEFKNKKKKAREDFEYVEGMKTIEQNVSKLDVKSYDLEFSVDPLFKNMTAKFDQSGANKLLCRILPCNENLDILLESNYEVNPCGRQDVLDKAIYDSTTKLKVKECTDKIGKEEVRIMSICHDLALIKNKYKLDSSYRDQLLEDLLQDEGEDVFLEEAPQELYENQVVSSFVDKNDDDIPENNNTFEDVTDLNFENNNVNGDAEIVNEIPPGNDVAPDVSLKENKSDLKTYLLNFGDGNSNLFREFSQKKLKIIQGRREKGPEEPKTKVDKQNFVFKLKSVPFEGEIFKQADKRICPVQAPPSNNLLSKKRKILPLYNYETSLSFNYFTTDYVQLKKDKRRDMKPFSANFISLINQDKLFDESLYGENEVDVDFNENDNWDPNEGFYNSKGAKVINRLFDGRFGKLYKTFNLKKLKTRMLQLLRKIQESGSSAVLTFKTFLKEINNDLEKESAEKVSHQVCFVCLLHLSNEENLRLDAIGKGDFAISFDKSNLYE